MKKNFSYIIYLLLFCFFTSNVYADDLICNYEFDQMAKFNLSLSYAHPTQPEFSEFHKMSEKDITFEFLTENFNYNFSDPSEQCPTLYYKETLKDKNRYKVEIYSYQEGEVTNTLFPTSSSGSINLNQGEDELDSHTCYYPINNYDTTSNDLSISITGDNISFDAANSDYSDYDIEVDGIEASMFANKKCPIIYTNVISKQGVKKIYLSATENDFSIGKEANSSVDNVTGDPIYDFNISDDIIDTDTKFNCDGLLGKVESKDSLAYYLQTAMEIIRYVAIAALIGLSTLDYFSAVASSDPDKLKKANQKTIKRIIYTVILFVFPILLEILLELTGVYGDSSDPLCTGTTGIGKW